jgi:glucose-1-phosphate adenylyltransferase
MVEMDRIYAYPFKQYWRDVGTIDSYFEANMGLLNEPPDFDLYDKDWVIHTRSEERPPARVSEHGRVKRSFISHGCVVAGSVEHSVLSPGVYVAEGAVVRDSIVMMDCIIGQGAVLDRVILDKEVVVGTDCQLGSGEDTRVNRRFPKHLNTGITVVGKRARIPSGYRVGRNCLIGSNVLESDFPENGALVLPSGGTVEHTSERSLAPMRR